MAAAKYYQETRERALRECPKGLLRKSLILVMESVRLFVCGGLVYK